jgi:hypothetical protein
MEHTDDFYASLLAPVDDHVPVGETRDRKAPGPSSGLAAYARFLGFEQQREIVEQLRSTWLASSTPASTARYDQISKMSS